MEGGQRARVMLQILVESGLRCLRGAAVEAKLQVTETSAKLGACCMHASLNTLR